MSLEIYLNTRPPLLEFFEFLQSYGFAEVLAMEDSEGRFHVCPGKDGCNEPGIYLLAPTRMDPYSQLPPVDSRCLADSLWKIECCLSGTAEAIELIKNHSESHFD